MLHPYAFRNRFVRFPDGNTFNLRPPNRLALSDSGYDIVEKKEASLWIGDSLLVTGQIPRTNDFEKGMPIHYSEVDGKLEPAKDLTGEDRIYAVMGGMHLTGGLFEKIIPRTVEELRKLEPSFMIPCHCSGVRAVQAVMNQMPDSFIQNSVGTTYTF